MTTSGGQGQNTQGSKEGTTNCKEPQLPPVFQVPGLGPYGLGMFHPNQDFKLVCGEPREYSPTPPLATASSKPPAFPP